MQSKGYVIRKDSEDGRPLFLVDRRITKACWWTAEPKEAIVYDSLKAANSKADTLQYGQPYVDSVEDAIKAKEEYDKRH